MTKFFHDVDLVSEKLNIVNRIHVMFLIEFLNCILLLSYSMLGKVYISISSLAYLLLYLVGLMKVTDKH